MRKPPLSRRCGQEHPAVSLGRLPNDGCVVSVGGATPTRRTRMRSLSGRGSREAQSEALSTSKGMGFPTLIRRKARSFSHPARELRRALAPLDDEIAGLEREISDLDRAEAWFIYGPAH